MKPFCEIMVSDVLPGLRAIITNELSQTHGLTQVQISKKMGITQPAVSQYMRDLRGKKVRIISSNEKVIKMAKNLAKDIAIGEVDSKYVHRKFCQICSVIREEGLICKLHEEACPSLEPCRICFK